MKKPAVDPTFTFAIALIMSLIVWFPSLRLTMKGDLDITDAGVRYFLALALSWAGVHLVCAIVATYASQAPRPPASPPPGASNTPKRRRDDEPVAEETEQNAA
jgi:hypothetical protein